MIDEGPSSFSDSTTDQVAGVVRFGGILEGRCEDTAEIRSTVSQQNERSSIQLELEFEGTHFSMVFKVDKLAGDRVTVSDKETFARTLEAIVAAALPGTVESTLHCIEVGHTDVTETLFGIEKGEIRAIGRQRPRESRDGSPQIRRITLNSPVDRIGMGRLTSIAVLTLVLFGLLAWQGRYFDRLWAPEADELVIELKSVHDAIDCSIEKSWGNYVLTFQRAEGYPATPEAATTWVDSAETIAEQAHRRAVTQGTPMWVRLLDEERNVMVWAPLSLQTLLGDPEAEVVVRLSGRIGGRTIDLSLSPPSAKK